MSSPQPEINIGTIGHIEHGKTTLIAALTGKWTNVHSEELKRGISIKLGYANFTIYKCPKCRGPEAYMTLPQCIKHKAKCTAVRTISFVDAPGHETLMATMLSGAAIMDGCILVIAANEPCPQPQTREHLTAIEIVGIKHIIIVQNKIDLVDEAQAKKSYNDIKRFVKGTIAENAPIIPMSAQQNTNMDVLLQAIEKYIPTPKRDIEKPPIMLIARSFDINRPGKDVTKLDGGALGGVLKQGRIKVGDSIIILPGVKQEDKDSWQGVETMVESLNTGDKAVKDVGPGGSVGLATQLDPVLCKGDRLAGSVVGFKEHMPDVFDVIDIEVHLLKRTVGTSREMEIVPIKQNENIMISAWTARTTGLCIQGGSNARLKLNRPVCIAKGEKIAVSRLIENRWRLVGYGIVL